ncbi:MAG: flagellin-like protein [Lachnospiraceae bacterium]|nr:flagellin-like protein [Lachnospiraceae bacterium]
MNLLNEFYIAWLCRLNAVKNDETGGSEMIAVVVMIGIVVILAVVFRNEIKDLIEGIFTDTKTAATKAMTPIEPK